MKNMITVIVCAILGVITLMIVMSVNGRMNRSMEVKSSLSSAVEETVKNLGESGAYSINDTNEYVTDFMQCLSDFLDADSDLAVEVVKADKEKGLLAIHVTESFLHPNGRNGTVECDRTVILSPADKIQQAQYTIRFYLTKADLDAGKNCYKICRVSENERITALANPQKEGESFDGWRDSEGNAADFMLPVTQDMAYYAQWH